LCFLVPCVWTFWSGNGGLPITIVIEGPWRVRLGWGKIILVFVVRPPYPRTVFTFSVVMSVNPCSI
jgi:hypothetical protein